MSLYLLQIIDLKIDHLNSRLQQINQILSDHSIENRIKDKLSCAKDIQSGVEKNLASIEQRINTTRIKLQQSESSLYGGKIHNPKELQDLESEIKMLKHSITQYEDQQFTIMLDLEQKCQAVHAFEMELEKVSKDFVSLSLSLQDEINEINKVRERNLTERNALVGSIDQTTLERYSSLRQTKAGIAVTQVDDNTCEKCGAEITQAVWQKARISNDLCYCGTCGRIIYAK
jgi:uncharacterized protein